MDWTQRVVTRTPLTELWTDQGPLEAERLGSVDHDRVRLLLSEASLQFVVADPGLALQWIPPSGRFRFWKEEVRPRLVESGAEGFRIEEFPGDYCFTASEWRLEDGHTVVLFERHH